MKCTILINGSCVFFFTFPKTSDDAQMWVIALGENFLIASKTIFVPCIFVCIVSKGEVKLVSG